MENKLIESQEKPEGGLRQIESACRNSFNFEVVVNRYEENGKQDEDC